MRIRVRPGPAALAASFGIGVAASSIYLISCDLFGSGPLAGTACLTTIAAALAVSARLAERAERLGAPLWMTAVAGGAALWRAEDLGRASLALAGPGTMGVATAVWGLAATSALTLPLAPALARWRRADTLAALVGLGAGAWLPREAALAVVLASAAILAGVPDHARARARHLMPVRAWAAAGIVACAAGALAWAVARPSIDPTPAGSLTVMAGIGLGLAAPRTRAVTLAGLIGIAVAAWAALTGRSGAPALAGIGLGVGLAARGVEAPVLTAVATAAVAWLLPLLPAGPSARWGRVGAAAPSDDLERARREIVLDESIVVYAGFGPTGSGVLRTRKSAAILELDGALSDAVSRPGDADRFAGLLAACATTERGRARIGGDDLGLAAGALRDAGFLAIDTAVPDRRWAAAHAALVPNFSRTLLHPAVRAIDLPAPTLLRAGSAADAVIELARSGWTDARNHAADARGIAAAARGLAETGVYVLVVGAIRADPATLDHLGHAMAESFANASLWLPPSGADAALFVGAPGPIPWTSMEACARTGAARQLDLADPLAIGTLALADRDTLRSRPAGRPAPLGLPATLAEAPSFVLSGYAGDAAAADGTFDEPGARALADRGEARRIFLEVLKEAGRGDVQEAITQARTLAETPGGERALDPLVRPHLAAARRAMAQGAAEGPTSAAWQRAEASLTTARLIHPRSGAARCMEGELAVARGQWERAETAFVDCAALAPDVPDAFDGVALVRQTRGNVAGAEAALRDGQSRFPDRWQSAHNLGFFLLNAGRHDEAERWLRQAASLAEAAGSVDVSPHLALARLYLRTDRAALALAAARRCTNTSPSAEADYLEGAALWELDDPQAAEAAFRRALARDARHVGARGGLGVSQAARGEHQQAIESFNVVLTLDPQNGPARENLRRLRALLQER